MTSSHFVLTHLCFLVYFINARLRFLTMSFVTHLLVAVLFGMTSTHILVHLLCSLVYLGWLPHVLVMWPWQSRSVIKMTSIAEARRITASHNKWLKNVYFDGQPSKSTFSTTSSWSEELLKILNSIGRIFGLYGRPAHNNRHWLITLFVAMHENGIRTFFRREWSWVSVKICRQDEKAQCPLWTPSIAVMEPWRSTGCHANTEWLRCSRNSVIRKYNHSPFRWKRGLAFSFGIVQCTCMWWLKWTIHFCCCCKSSPTL